MLIKPTSPSQARGRLCLLFSDNVDHEDCHDNDDYHDNVDFHDNDDFHDIDVSGIFRNRMDLEKAERVISAGKQAAQEMGVSTIIL